MLVRTRAELLVLPPVNGIQIILDWLKVRDVSDASGMPCFSLLKQINPFLFGKTYGKAIYGARKKNWFSCRKNKLATRGYLFNAVGRKNFAHGVGKANVTTHVWPNVFVQRLPKAVRWKEGLGVAAELPASWVIERLQATTDNAVADVLRRWLSNVFHYKLWRDGLPREHEAPRRT